MSIVVTTLSALTLLLVLASTAYLELRLRRLRQRLPQDVVKEIKNFSKHAAWTADADDDQPTIDRNLWSQIESLTALYRLIDGQVALPSTRRWAASPDILLRLVRHIQRNPVQTIVECGSGTSTIVIAHALKLLGRAGHIHTIENNPFFARQLQAELEARNLQERVTVIVAPLVEKRYENFEQIFHWYDLSAARIPDQIDLLFVDGPYGKVNRHARFPAGPELLPKMAPTGHIFVDDAKRSDESALGRLWRTYYPDLGIRTLDVEKGALEMFFLDQKVKSFLPCEGGEAPRDLPV
jgi:predicted O-methyltransferase YrrM